MRVAYVCADRGVPVFGWKGCSIHVQEVIGALRCREATVELFATHLEGSPPAALASLRIHPLPPPPKGERVERVTLMASTGGAATMKLTTVSGKEYTVPSRIVSGG